MTVKMNIIGGAGLLSPGKLTPYSSPDAASLAGWTPVLAGEVEGVKSYIKVVDWVGGGGTKPAVNQYIGPTGYVATKAEATNFNVAKRVNVWTGVTTNVAGQATVLFTGADFANPPIAMAWATPSVLAGNVKAVVSAVTKTQCTVTVTSAALATGLVAALAGATVTVLTIET